MGARFRRAALLQVRSEWHIVQAGTDSQREEPDASEDERRILYGIGIGNCER